MALNPGDELGHYSILEAIGKGGMGEVYRARDPKLGRDVAIKVLPESIASDSEKVTRFEREARLLAALNHPNIATLHGFEVSEGIHFLVMELIEGETLSDRIARGPIPVEEASSIFQQIAGALEVAHERGIVHRDLKPANIKITPDGIPKVLDFGLAKAFGAELTGQTRSDSPTLTREGTSTGVILGTAAYMSPEQARGLGVDKRTDIWSFGCCLFEALAGTAAFLGPTVSDTIAAILEREPDWKSLPVRTPQAVRRLLTRCLTKDSINRLRDIGDARIELAGVPDEPIETEESIPRRHGTVVAAIVVALVSIAIGIWSTVRRVGPASDDVVRSVLPLPESESLQVWTVSSAVAISPDGRYVAYVVGQADKEETRKLHLRRLDQLEPRVVDGSEEAATPFFSHDSQWVGFWKDGMLMRAAVSGGAPQPIAGVSGTPAGADWGEPAIVIARGDHLSLVTPRGGEPKILTTFDSDRREVEHRYPQVLPDGKSVLFTVATSTLESWDDALIAVASLETGDHRVIFRGGSHARYSPTGHLVYVHGGTLHAVGFDLEKLEVVGQPVPLVEGVMTVRSGSVGEFALADDGTLVYAPGRSRIGDHRVVWVDRAGQEEPLIDAPRRYVRPRLSPDGQRLALAVQTALASIWLHDIERQTLTRWTTEWRNGVMTWSPDGDEIVFTSSRPGPFNLYRKSVAGTGPAERLTTSEFQEVPTSWSPDGTTIGFQRQSNDRGHNLWLLRLEAEREPELFLGARANEQMASFSPDGRWIAYQSDQTGRFEIYVCRFPDGTGTQPVSTEGGYEPRWNPKGGELFYRNADQLMVVSVEAADGELNLGRPEVLFERPFFYHSLGSYDVAPDGQRFHR